MCGGSKWKREEVPDHKFDFIDTREFYDNSFFMRVKYIWVYVIVLKSFLVYISDIFSAITMLSSKTWSNQIFQECGKKDKTCFYIPFDVGKWLFVSCIIFSFLLLAYEAQKSKKIIASRDISFAFTNVMANNYYSLRSYNHFCFFEHISDSTKTIDDFAFFVFFTFKSWKRLLLADGPRQTINAITLYAVYTLRKDKESGWWELSQYFKGNSMSTTLLTITAAFTVIVFAGSLLLLIVAAICYIPLIFHIRGNLKEYCCHKVDKRIADVMKRRRKERLAENAKLAQKEAMGDFSHLKNKKGEVVGKPLPQPTLPNISLDDDDDTSTIATSRAGGSTKKFYEADNSSLADYPPPMPAYNPYSAHQASYGPQYNMSTTSVTGAYDDPTYGQPYHDDDTAHFTSAAATPYTQSPSDYYSQHSAGTGISRHGTPAAPGSAYDDSRQQSDNPYYLPSTTPQPVDDRYYHPSSTPQPGAFSRRM